MSNIQSNSAALRQVLTSRSEANTPSANPARRSQSPDQMLMHAWSIGTTRAVQELPDRKMPQRDECPPEVYIG